jgi:PAS domain S-box-containing protein
MPVLQTYDSELQVRAEVILPRRVVPPRPTRTTGHRIDWRCGPSGEVEPHLHGAASPAREAAKRVAVIDDESSIRMLCRVNLSASGIDVLEADNGTDGVELIRKERPDLVLLDVMMPGFDGWEVARRLAADPRDPDRLPDRARRRCRPAHRRAARRRRLRREAVRSCGNRQPGRERAGANRTGRARAAPARDPRQPPGESLSKALPDPGLSIEALADAADRANRLQRVSDRLAEALTPQEVLDAILTDGLRAAEARAGAIGVVTDDGEWIELLAQRGYKGPILTEWHRFPVSAELPMSHVIRTGEPLFLESLEARNELFPNLEGRGRDGHALAVLPLELEGRRVGVIGLSFGDDMVFSEERRKMKITLARQASLALERARLFVAEQVARERLTFIAEASELLASSLDYEQTLARLAELSVPLLADWCAIDMVGGDGRIERLAVAHEDPEKVKWALELQDRYPPDPTGAHGVSYVIRTGEAEFLPELPEEMLEEAIGDDEQLREIVDQLGLRSSICVPLNARGRTLGALTLIAAESHPPYTQADFELAVELARRAGIAVDNSRLFREAERGANAARALAYVADGVVLVDRSGVVRHWNPAAATITGVAEHEAVGRQVRSVLPAWELLTSHVPLVRPDDALARPVAVPMVIQGKELWVSVSGVDFGEGTVYALRDVTDEQALEKTRSDFVATASHELRTPLAAVYGAVRTLRREDIDLSDKDRATFLEIIEDESVRLTQIVDQILLAGQLDADVIDFQLESCDPVQLASGVLESASLHLPEGVSLRVEQEGARPILCDVNKLRQVLVNLVDNAIKYSPEGGEVEIRLGSANGECQIEVADQGLGIPSSERERIFEKFYRLDPQQTGGVGGSGLGLYICRELVERMNGRLEVDSEPGKGSRFTVALPAGV